MRKKLNGRIFAISILFFVISTATNLFAEVPKTSYTDVVTGKAEVADLSRIKNVGHEIEVINQPTVEHPVIELKVTQRVTAAIAEVDIVERTTVRRAKGWSLLGPVGTALFAVNIVNPMMWAIGQNPLNLTQQSINSQVTNYKLTYLSQPRPLPGQATRSFVMPFANQQIKVVAKDIFDSFVFSYRTNAAGSVVVRLQPILALLQAEGVRFAPRQALKLTIATESGQEDGWLTVNVPRRVVARVLEAEQ